MRLVRYGEAGAEKPGLIDADNVLRDLSEEIDDLSGDNLSRATLDRLRALDPKGLAKADPSHRLGPPVGRIGNFIAVGLNYADHARESGAEPPTEPVIFNKAPSSVSGPMDDIPLPPDSQRLDWEVEVAAVIGDPAWRIKEDAALSHVAGFTLCHDVSERDWQQNRGGQWTKGKSAPGFGPLGPWLVTTDHIADPQGIDLWLEVNGERMQTGTTREMIFGFAQIVAYLSNFMRLMPGDVITTGTPAGVGMGMKPARYLKDGDIVTLGSPLLGSQRQTVRLSGH